MVADALTNYDSILLAMWGLSIEVLYTISIKTDKFGNKTNEARMAEYVLNQKQKAEEFERINKGRALLRKPEPRY